MQLGKLRRADGSIGVAVIEGGSARVLDTTASLSAVAVPQSLDPEALRDLVEWMDSKVFRPILIA